VNLSLLNVAVIGVLGLLGIGFYGMLVCRNLFKVVVALQILVKAALLVLQSSQLSGWRLAFKSSASLALWTSKILPECEVDPWRPGW
jgi:multisubunit Na+/H+ antiporter MnhC subunit